MARPEGGGRSWGTWVLSNIPSRLLSCLFLGWGFQERGENASPLLESLR